MHYIRKLSKTAIIVSENAQLQKRRKILEYNKLNILNIEDNGVKWCMGLEWNAVAWRHQTPFVDLFHSV